LFTAGNYVPGSEPKNKIPKGILFFEVNIWLAFVNTRYIHIWRQAFDWNFWCESKISYEHIIIFIDDDWCRDKCSWNKKVFFEIPFSLISQHICIDFQVFLTCWIGRLQICLCFYDSSRSLQIYIHRNIPHALHMKKLRIIRDILGIIVTILRNTQEDFYIRRDFTRGICIDVFNMVNSILYWVHRCRTDEK